MNPEPYEIIVACNLMAPMRDGVRLATDAYRPAQGGEFVAGSFPVVLCRTPYNKSDPRYTEIAAFFTPRGYVTVLQDLRARHRSEGAGQYFHTANPHEGIDGYDTIEWIAAQPWCNGKIGMVGSSFAAVAQVAAALEKPPHLAAIWPDVTPTNNYFHQAREGGAMQLHMFWALFVHAQDDLEATAAEREIVWQGLRDMRCWIKATPWRRGETPLAAIPRLEQVLIDYYTRGEYDEFWVQKCNNAEAFFAEHADIPGVFSSGWFDPYATAMTNYYAHMAQQNQTSQRLVMGPWTHVGMRGNSSFAGNVDFGLAAVWGVPRYFAEQLQFFEHTLNGQAVIGDELPVKIFVMGGGDGHRTPQGKFFHGGYWRGEAVWPLARSKPTAFYCHADSVLRTAPPTQAEAQLSYDFDPNHPVPTIGGSLCGIFELPPDKGELDEMWLRFLSPMLRLSHIVPPGSAHQKEEPHVFGAATPYPRLAERPDVLVFQTPPLEEDIEVTGAVAVHLWVSSSAPDTDFTAKLIDVCPPNSDYPEGYELNLVDSVLRARYRNGWQRPEFMEPGTAYPICIQLPPTSNLFQRGHRIRLDISSSNFPRLDVNPNTGEPIGKHTRMEVAHNTIHCDRDHPSHAILPIVPV